MKAIVFDLDNTIVETAVRKHGLLREHLRSDAATLQAVRDDYHLTSFFDRGEQLARDYFRSLDTDRVIRRHRAPVMAGALEVVEEVKRAGYHVCIVTARPVAIEEATRDELAWLGLDRLVDVVFLLGAPYRHGNADSHIQYKKDTVGMIARRHEVMAVVGDRPEDIVSALHVDAAAVVLASTMSREEIDGVAGGREDVKVHVCQSWRQIQGCLRAVAAL